VVIDEEMDCSSVDEEELSGRTVMLSVFAVAVVDSVCCCCLRCLFLCLFFLWLFTVVHV
jgi:hypothetical protein